MMMMMIIIIIIQFNSIQWSLLMCNLNSTGANYKTSIRIQIQHTTAQIHKNKTLNKLNKTNIVQNK
jgi:hypothetical protein